MSESVKKFQIISCKKENLNIRPFQLYSIHFKGLTLDADRSV